MIAPHSLSQAALDAGVPPRFVYWQGHSRRRYLFTRTSFQGLKDFEDGVVLVVEGGEVVWTGEVAEASRLAESRDARPRGVYVHLLAGGLAERRLVIEDFEPDWRADCRMAA
jgi:hypothetical protein